jgi:predicted SAM-dependent methyltransferase
MTSALRHRVALACVVAGGPLLGLALARLLPTAAYWIWSLDASREIRRYNSVHSVRMLQIGSGTVNLPGWLNTDIEPGTGQTYLDATKRFPISDGSMQYIFAEQVIEHLTYDQGLSMLRECYRVLAPGGKIRLATPDLMKYFQLLQDPNSEQSQRYIEAKLKFHFWPRTSEPAANIFNMELRSFGHQFLYDQPTLSDSLSRAGFQRISSFAPGESDEPQLRGIDWRHNSDLARESNDYESMVLQAARP